MDYKKLQVDYKQQGDELSHYESAADTASQQLRKLDIKYEMLKVGEWKVRMYSLKSAYNMCMHTVQYAYYVYRWTL